MRGLASFKKTIWSHYRKHRRDFPWRNPDATSDPYKIIVSEIMLQQTQAKRAVSKYESFIQRFPDWQTLNKASTADVLREWQGLGYNRRALYLHRIAQLFPSGNITPNDIAAGKLPGIGPNTKGSVLAFAWNIPRPFIETNIRSVFIHFFFKNKKSVDDKSILTLVTETLDHKNPREWYYALMDYGAYLKAGGNGAQENPSRKSKHHTKQSKFKGSNRELRGAIVRSILAGTRDKKILIKKFSNKFNKEQVAETVQALDSEGFFA